MKILIPLVAWSLIYLGWYCGTHPNTCTRPVVWDLLLVEGAYYHLWFLYAILNIYLILPVLRLMIQPNTDQRILWYLIVLWLVFQGIISIAHKFWDFRIRLDPPLTTGFVCFLILGYLLGEITLTRGRVVWSVVIWMLATFVTTLGTYVLTRNSGEFDGFFYDFVSLNVILASAAAFLLLRWMSETEPLNFLRVQGTVRSLALSSFGIYLIHIIVIEILSGWLPGVQIDTAMGHALWSIPLLSTLVFSLSYFAVRILQHIPLVKRIVP